MTLYLADVTRQTARLVTRTVIGVNSATGTSTQLIDAANLAGFPDNQFVGGTVWVTSGTNAGLSRVVTAFSDSLDRITHAGLPGNTGSGATFEVAAADFVEYRDLRQAANLALREYGKILDKNDTLAIVDDQLVYTLPSGVANVEKIEVMYNLGDADERRQINTHWEEIEGKLVFEYTREPTTLDGEYIRIWYRTFAAELTADTSAVDEQIDEEYLIYLAARQAMRLSYKRFGKAGAETIPEWLNEAIEEAKKHVRARLYEPYIRTRTA